MPGQPQLECPIPIGVALAIDQKELTVIDPSGLPSNLIIDPGSPFNLETTFLIGGSLARFFVGLGVPCEIEYFFEGLGDLPEGSFGTVSLTSSDGVPDPAECGGSGAFVYSGTVTNLLVPAGKLSKPGTYRLSTVVTFLPGACNGDAPAPGVTGFVEGPIIRQL